MLDALAQLMEERGFEREWPRGHYRRLKAAGLTDVGMERHVTVREGGSPGAALLAANFAQVRSEAVAKRLVTDAEVEPCWRVSTSRISRSSRR